MNTRGEIVGKIEEVKEGCIFAHIGAHPDLTKTKVGVETEYRVFKFYFDDAEENNLKITSLDNKNVIVEIFFESGIDSQGNAFPETRMEFLITKQNGKVRYFVNKIEAEDVPNAGMIKPVKEYTQNEELIFITRDRENVEYNATDDIIENLFLVEKNEEHC